MIAHLALALLVPAAVLAWRWSKLVSAALWLTLATWLTYRGIKWQWPEAHAAGHLEWMRGVSAVTGLVGAVEAVRAHERRMWLAGFANGSGAAMTVGPRRRDVLAVLLAASMAIDLTALLIHLGTGQWGPQPFFQVGVLLAMCAIAWPRRKS